MRILHLIQRFPPAIGGAEAWCEGVARYCAGRGDSVEVQSLDVVDEAGLWKDVHPVGPIAVGPVDRYSGLRVRRSRPSATPWSFIRVLDSLGIHIAGRYSAELFGRVLGAARHTDVVHVHHHVVPLSFWGLFVARLTGRPVVITPHLHPGDPVNEQKAAWWLVRRCDVVIAVTSFEAERYRQGGVPSDRVVVASNAIASNLFHVDRQATIRSEVRVRLGLRADTQIVTFIGRKREGKGLQLLVKAADRIARSRNIALLLVGPPSNWYHVALPTWRDLGVNVIDVPSVSEETKSALLAASDVLVQPSLQEAFGIVFLEAWASGVPVVGAAWGAIPEVVGDAGLTFAPNDTDDLARKVEWLLIHREDARAMAERGRIRVMREHTWERVGSSVARAYAIASAVRGHGRGRSAAVTAAYRHGSEDDAEAARATSGNRNASVQEPQASQQENR